MALSSRAVHPVALTKAPAHNSKLLQRKCASCGEKEAVLGCESCKRKLLQRRVSIPGGSVLSARSDVGLPGLSSRLSHYVDQALEHPGRPLDANTRIFMEQGFSTSFANVRIHDDSVSHGASRVLGAEAFAHGQHIHFASGRYRPSSRDGLNLIAHELTHTVQQRAMPANVSRIEVGAPDSPLEHEADRAAENAVAGIAPGPLNGAPSPVIQRKGSPGVQEIGDLLSYGLLDWAITDSEALQALDKLHGLSRIEQAEFLSDRKFADRLRENLPESRVPELNAMEYDVQGMMPASTTVDAIIDRLSYGIFDWAITDSDAVEALEFLKTLSGDQLAVTLKRIDYGRLMDNLPEPRRQELVDLLAAGSGAGTALPESANKEPVTALRSLDFTSDHGPMKDNDSDWSSSGTPFPQPDWLINDKGEARSDAISHTRGKQIQIDVGFDVTPQNASASNAVITGKGSKPFLNFQFSGALSGSSGQSLTMMASDKIPDAVTSYRDQSIAWTINWGNGDHAMRSTGPFDIYTTIAAPADQNAVTRKRMAKAVQLVSSAPSMEPHAVVKEIMQKWTTFNLDVRYANEWDLAGDMNKGAQCIDLVRFAQSVIGMVGLPGLAEAVIVWAQPTDPFKGIETPWGQGGGMSGGTILPFPGQPQWQAMLLDGGFRPNNFEAALKFTADGQMKYYPGGVPSVLDNPDQVLQVFNCLAWYTVTGADSYQIANVPGPYRAGKCNIGDSHTFSGKKP